MSHSNSANRELSNDVLVVVVRRRKVALFTSSHLTPIESMTKRCFHQFGGTQSIERGTVRKLHASLGMGQIWTACNSQLRKIALHTCSDLSKLVRTCLNQSAIQWPCTPVVQCHFLHFRMLLFFSLMSYPAEIAYFNSPNGELSNGVRVMALYWSKIVDPSRSPCLKTVQRKSFERG